MSHHLADCTFLYGRIKLGLFSSNDVEKICNVSVSHIATTAKCSTSFTTRRFAVSYFFTAAVKNGITFAVNKNSSFAAVNNGTTVAAVCIVSVSAFPVPGNDFIFRKPKSGIHGVIHYPTIIFKMTFCGFNFHFFRIFHPVSYTHLRAHETRHDLVCRLLLEKK